MDSGSVFVASGAGELLDSTSSAWPLSGSGSESGVVVDGDELEPKRLKRDLGGFRHSFGEGKVELSSFGVSGACSTRFFMGLGMGMVVVCVQVQVAAAEKRAKYINS